MDARTLATLARGRQLPTLLALSRTLVVPFYRATFLAAAAGNGILRRLAEGPCDAATLAADLGLAGDVERLVDWLDIGVRLRVLARVDGRYGLRSRAARALSRADADPVAGALEEVVRFHGPALQEAPTFLRQGRRRSLDDQDGAVIARSSLVLQPFVEEAVARVLARDRPVRLLEIGCGSGVYVRHAATLNPRLRALALDMQADVAAAAAARLAEWGLADRVEVRHADFRSVDLEPQFDLVTLHNAIYYFSVAERVEVLARARSLLAPGGTLLLTTSCRGAGSVGVDVLDLWFDHADFGGRLPHPGELADQMARAGFSDISVRRCIPGEQFRSFVGVNPTAHPRPAWRTR